MNHSLTYTPIHPASIHSPTRQPPVHPGNHPFIYLPIHSSMQPLIASSATHSPFTQPLPIHPPIQSSSLTGPMLRSRNTEVNKTSPPVLKMLLS